MKYRSFEYIIVLIVVLASISMIRLNATPYSTDEMNHKDATKLLSQGRISTNEFTHAFTKVNDTYYPSQPIGFSVFSLPLYWLFSIENKLFNTEPQFYFSSGFYPPEVDDRGTYYWLKDNGTIKVYSKENALVKFGFSGISFVQDRKVNISFRNESVFDSTVSIYPQWYETYFPARKGLNELSIDAGECILVSEVKDANDYRCVSLMLQNPEFVSFVATPFIERSELYAFSGNEPFSLEVANPNTFPVRTKINVIAKSSQSGTLTIQAGKKEYSFDISENQTEIFTDFITLEPEQTDLEFEIENCITCSVLLQRIEFYLENDFYDEEFIYENGFFLEEVQGGKRWRWLTDTASLIIFSENGGKTELKLDVWSFAKNRELSIFANDKLIDKEEISPVSKEIIVQLSLKPGRNQIILQTDSCDSPNITDEPIQDHRCLSFGISR